MLGAAAVPLPHIRRRLAALRSLTGRPFRVSLVLDVLQEGQIEVCFDEKIELQHMDTVGSPMGSSSG